MSNTGNPFDVADLGSDDSAENPTFGDSDMPRIYRDWLPNLVYNVGDTLRLDHPVSPSDGATFAWKLDGEVISNEMTLEYILTDFGNFTLEFEVERNGIKNFRTAALVVAKEFESKWQEGDPISLGFLTVKDGSTISDIPWGDITHLVVSSAFINNDGPYIPKTIGVDNPDTEEDERTQSPLLTTDLPALITTAHNYGVYVLIQYSGVITHLNAVATYGEFTFYNAVTGTTRDNVISTMIEFAGTNGFDGINIYMDKAHDLTEYPNPEALQAFYDELAVAVPTETSRGKFYLTMSLYAGWWVPTAYAPLVHNERYDWYNVFAFAAEDLVSGPHSSLWGLMEPYTSTWITNQSVLAEKMIPVAPAFGLRYFGNVADYTWGNLWQYTQYLTYRQICEDYPGAETVAPGFQDVDNGLWYDSVADVKQKAEYAAGQGWGGMGLWSLDSDSQDPAKSLMHQIYISLYPAE